MTNNIEHIKTKGVSHTYLFLLLTLMMLFKCCLFAHIAEIKPAETTIYNKVATWLSWGAISMLIASVVFVTRRWWAVLITMTTFDMWFIANVYWTEELLLERIWYRSSPSNR